MDLNGSNFVLNAVEYTSGLVQDCSVSNANALELLQSCTKPSIYPTTKCCSSRISTRRFTLSTPTNGVMWLCLPHWHAMERGITN